MLRRKLPLHICISRHPYFTSADLIPRPFQVFLASLALSSQSHEVPMQTQIGVLPEQRVIWTKASTLTHQEL